MAHSSFQSEDELTRWLALKAPAIGDDAAFLPRLGATATTVDSQREGVHFLPGTPPAVIARRLLAVNLSDLAATGAKPHHALCTLAAPTNFDRRAFFVALLEACAHYQIELVGGDLSSSQHVECTLTATGTRLARGQFLTRTNARQGQDLWLAGSLGESALGLRLLRAGAHFRGKRISLPRGIPAHLKTYARHCLNQHLQPSPELGISQWLASRRCSIAAIDISDGLAQDLHRLADKSNVGLKLDQPAIESRTSKPAFTALCRHLESAPLTIQLSGGEDYALAFSAPTRLAKRILSLDHPQLAKIGKVTEKSEGLRLMNGQARHALAANGWDHLNL